MEDTSNWNKPRLGRALDAGLQLVPLAQSTPTLTTCWAHWDATVRSSVQSCDAGSDTVVGVADADAVVSAATTTAATAVTSHRRGRLFSRRRPTMRSNASMNIPPALH